MTDTNTVTDQPTTEAPTIAPTFEAIIHNEELLKAVQNLGFSAPTPIQSGTLPVALQGKDLIIQARTGSGKTYAFVMPLVGLLLEREVSKSDVFGLIIVPTRELAVQVREAITSLMPSLDPVCVIGGASMEAQIDHLKRDPRIVVGTPGRLLDLLRQRALKLNRCRYFVLDEADETLSSGFLEDVRAILSRLPDERQGIFASATITPRVDMLANSFLTKPEQVIVDVTEKDFPAVTHFYCDVPGDLMAKPNILCDFIETWRPRSAIIFCNTKSDTQLVELFLRRRGFDARRLNSDLTQSQRTKVMKKIRDGELRFLVATDIAARGIDIEQLDLVINYAIHEQTETYVHRTGRTGRAGRSGRALSLIGPRDFGSFHFLKKVLELEFNQVPLPSDDDLANARLSHLYEILREPHMELGSRDVEVARKLLKEMGGVEEPSEEFEQIVAKLIRHNLEHHVQEEARSLEEELEEAQGGGAEERSEPRRESQREGERREERGGREHRRDERERRPERQSSEPRREETRGGRNERERGQHDKPSSREERSGARERGGEERRGRGDERRDERREDRGAREPRRNEREQRLAEPRREEARGRDGGRRDERERGPSARESARDDRPRKPDQLRLYVGQGTAHGMTPQIFTELAKEFADINPEGIKHLVVREQYGFVDLEKPLAERLIENLNGIEYNGFDLPVEVATVIRAEQHHHRRR